MLVSIHRILWKVDVLNLAVQLWEATSLGPRVTISKLTKKWLENCNPSSFLARAG